MQKKCNRWICDSLYTNVLSLGDPQKAETCTALKDKSVQKRNRINAALAEEHSEQKHGSSDAHGMWDMWGQWSWTTDYRIHDKIESFRIKPTAYFSAGFQQIRPSHHTSPSKVSLLIKFVFQKILKIPDILWQSHLKTLCYNILSWSLYLENNTGLRNTSFCGYNRNFLLTRRNLAFSSIPILFN